MVKIAFMLLLLKKDGAHLQRIDQSFKEKNDAWSNVRVIIIDKDFTKHKVLKEEFPEAVILYCQWHVVKALFKAICECNIEKEDRDECRELIRLIVHAKSIVRSRKNFIVTHLKNT